MNQTLLESLVSTINGREGGSSHLVTVPPSPHLADALLSSPIVQVSTTHHPSPTTPWDTSFTVDHFLYYQSLSLTLGEYVELKRSLQLQD